MLSRFPAKSNMKVALMHNFFYSNSGATEVVFNTAIQLKKWDHNVYVFVLNGKDDVLRRFDEEGIHAESASFTEWRTNNTRFLSIIDSIMLFVNKIRAFILFMSLAGRINRDYDVAFTSHYHLTPLMHIFRKMCIRGVR